MAQETDLSIKISADVERAIKGIASLRGEIARLSSSRAGGLKDDIDGAEGSLKRMLGTSISLRGALAGLGAGLAIRAIIRETVEAEAAFTQIENVVKSTGQAAGYTAPQLAKMASELQNVTTFGDESILRMQAVLLGFRNVQGPVFREASELALDLSTRLGRDLTSSAQLLGKALQDPTKAADALRRSGVLLSDTQDQLIKKMTASGNIAGAQRVILDELQKSYGGAARAARDTFGGSLEGLKNAFGDLLEGKSGLKEAKNAVNDLTKTLQDPRTQAAFDNFISLIAKGAEKLASFAAAFNAMATGPTSETERITEQIALITRGINELETSLAKPRWKRGNFFLHEDFFTSDATLNAQLKRLTDERKRLVLEYEAALNQPAPTSSEPGPTGAGFAPPPASDEFVKANAELQKRIALNGVVTEQEKTLYEIEHGRFQDLTRSEKDALLRKAELLDAMNAETKANEDATAAQKKHNEELDQTAEELRKTINPYRELEQWLAKVKEAYDAGKLSLDEYLDAQFVFQDKFEAMGKTAKTTTESMSQFAIQAARDMQQAWSNGFFDIMNGNFDSLGQQFSDLLKRMAAELAASQVMQLLFGDYGTTGQLGGLVGSLAASIAHTGGTVGGGLASRSVSPLAFVGAPRYHGGGVIGLAPDEVPVIARRGEVVMTPEQLANRGQPVKVQIDNRGTPISAQSADVRFDAEGMVVKIITEDAQRGGPIVNTLRRSLTR